jgi:hypothetical protein
VEELESQLRDIRIGMALPAAAPLPSPSITQNDRYMRETDDLHDEDYANQGIGSPGPAEQSEVQHDYRNEGAQRLTPSHEEDEGERRWNDAPAVAPTYDAEDSVAMVLEDFAMGHAANQERAGRRKNPVMSQNLHQAITRAVSVLPDAGRSNFLVNFFVSANHQGMY